MKNILTTCNRGGICSFVVAVLANSNGSYELITDGYADRNSVIKEIYRSFDNAEQLYISLVEDNNGKRKSSKLESASIGLTSDGLQIKSESLIISINKDPSVAPTIIDNPGGPSGDGVWGAGSGINSAQQKGTGSLARSDYSVAEGELSETTKSDDFIEHYNDGRGAHAEGGRTTAMGSYSHTEGNNTIANNAYEHAEGHFNVSHISQATYPNAGNTIHSIGIGSNLSNAKNAVEVMQNGDYYMIGVGGYDGTNYDSAQTVQEIINNGSSGKTWRELELSREQFDNINRGIQISSTIPSYSGTNFVNDYARIVLDNSSELYGSRIKPNVNLESLYINFSTEEWKGTQLERLLNEVNYSGFNFDYYKTLVLYAGCDSESYILEGDNVITGKNVVYIQDTSQQDWEKKWDEKQEEHRDSLAIEAYGQCYGLHIKGDTDTLECIFAYQNTQQAYWNESDEVLEWKNIEAGKVYHAHYDHECGTGRWLVELDSDGEPLAYTDVELAELLENPIMFELDKVAAEGLRDTANGIKTTCVGYEPEELFRVFSFNNVFEESEPQVYEFIGRPNAEMAQTYEYYDAEGIFHIEENGIYVWDIEVMGTSISVVIPKTLPTTCIIQRRVENGGTAVVISQQSINLYRHVCKILSNNDILPSSGYKLAISALIINSQIGDSSLDYMLHSDESGRNEVPASGVIGIPKEDGYDYYPVGLLAADWIPGTKPIRCIQIEYFDTTLGSTSVVNVITDENKQYYTCELATSIIASVLTNGGGVSSGKVAHIVENN